MSWIGGTELAALYCTPIHTNATMLATTPAMIQWPIGAAPAHLCADESGDAEH